MSFVVRFVVLSTLAVVGCTPTVASHTDTTAASAARTCPLGVPGATVAAEDVPGGVALVMTSTDRLEELRSRARDAASLYGTGTNMGAGHEGKHGSGGDHGLQPMQLPPGGGAALDVDGGTRIVLRPTDAADLETLRAKVRERAARMRASTCK